jgi:hypothetical protein
VAKIIEQVQKATSLKEVKNIKNLAGLIIITEYG